MKVVIINKVFVSVYVNQLIEEIGKNK